MTKEELIERLAELYLLRDSRRDLTDVLDKAYEAGKAEALDDAKRAGSERAVDWARLYEEEDCRLSTMTDRMYPYESFDQFYDRQVCTTPEAPLHPHEYRLDPFPDCRACVMPEAIVGSPRIDDVAMDLARRGKGAHEIRHTMMAYAKLASDRAIEWAKAEDERYRLENEEAKWDTDHGTEYEDPES